MWKLKYLPFSLCFMIAGYLFGAEHVDAPPPKDFGYGHALTEDDRNVLLIQLLPDEKGNAEHTVNAKVVADTRGKIKEGATVQIHGATLLFTGAWQYNLPTKFDPHDKEILYVWPVENDGAGKYKYHDDQIDFPIGVNSETRIALSDTEKVKAAFKELRAAVDAPGHAGPRSEEH